MKPEHHKALDALLSKLDNTTSPSGMTKTEALEFLEEVEDACDSRAGCLREELANEAEE